MPDSQHPDDWVTLARVADLTTGQLVCGRLAAEGIEAMLPDEHMAAQIWQLHAAIGGIRVQVRRGDVERAKEVLAQPGLPDLIPDALTDDGAGPGKAADSAATASSPDDGTISPGDRAAFRSLRVALVTLLLMGLLHPYSLWLAFAALQRTDLTAWGKRRAGIALVVSVAGCIWLVLLILRLARLGH